MGVVVKKTATDQHFFRQEGHSTALPLDLGGLVLDNTTWQKWRCPDAGVQASARLGALTSCVLKSLCLDASFHALIRKLQQPCGEVQRFPAKLRPKLLPTYQPCKPASSRRILQPQLPTRGAERSLPCWSPAQVTVSQRNNDRTQ